MTQRLPPIQSAEALRIRPVIVQKPAQAAHVKRRMCIVMLLHVRSMIITTVVQTTSELPIIAHLDAVRQNAQASDVNTF